MRVKTFSNFEECQDAVILVDSDKEVEVIIDYLIPEELPKPKGNKIRFVVNIQPEGQFNDLIRQYQNNYDYLLTFIPELLTLPKARFFIGLTPFCDPDPSTEKEFGVSCVFSTRNCLPGHKLRNELWRRQNEILIPKQFYTGQRSGMTGGIWLSSDKKAKRIAMQTMFHIAIDSYDYDNSFSEKLIDPMINMSLPVYWGAKNADQFFNPMGFLQCQSVDEIIKVCNSLSDIDYYQRIPYMEHNFVKAIEYYDYGRQLQRKIQEILNENA
jgi:hypothetical protein